MLLQAGKTVKEISKFADLDRGAVTEVAREVDIDPPHPTQRRAKELFRADDGPTYQQIADVLNKEKLKTDEGKKVHYLTVSTWVANFGWAWGGAADGEYAPVQVGTGPARSKYTLRLSKTMAADINTATAVSAAAEAAWQELESDNTRIVAVAIIRGAAKVGVTDIAAVKKALFATHGDAIRTAKA